MYIGYDQEQEALRVELRAYYVELLTPEIREGLHRGKGIGETMRSVVRQMGQHGWLGMYQDGDVDWDEAREFIVESFRMTAPKRIAAQLDEDGEPPKE